MATQKWANARWYIGTKTTALENEAAWVRIAEGRATSGSFGKEWQTTDSTTFDRPYRRNSKTVWDGGQLDLTYLKKVGDAGQAALTAACDDTSDDPYNFKVELDDAPVNGTPTTFRFRAQVTSNQARGGSPTNILERMARLDIEDEVIEMPAAA
jgi:hypothetical protein